MSSLNLHRSLCGTVRNQNESEQGETPRALCDLRVQHFDSFVGLHRSEHGQVRGADVVLQILDRGLAQLALVE